MTMTAATLLLSPPPHLRPPHHPTPSSRLSRLPAFSYRSSNGVPDTECPVPLDQQPVHEYQSLSTSVPFSWAAAEFPRYCSRLALTGAAFALLLGLPVASFGARIAGGDPHAEALRCAIGAVSTGLLAVTFAVLRMYLGWAYVGNRLLSATVEYEETGWYDGQIWVKTPEVLARDRLLGSFSVKPVLNRVKLTLIGLAVSLVACGILYISVDSQKSSSLPEESGGRAVVGVYSEASARPFEPDAFAGNPSQSET